MTENFLNLGKETDTQVQEAQTVLHRNTLQHIVITMTKVVEQKKPSYIAGGNNKLIQQLYYGEQYEGS